MTDHSIEAERIKRLARGYRRRPSYAWEVVLGVLAVLLALAAVWFL